MALSVEEQLQRYLHFLGEDPGKIDGIRGDNTDAAVARLINNATDKEPFNGLTAESPTSDLLNTLQEAAETTRATHQSLFDETRQLVDQLETLDNNELKSLQTNLSKMNLYHDRLDGLIGPNTRAAAEMFGQIFADEIDAAQSRQLERAREQALSAIAGSALSKQPDDVIRQTWEQTRDSGALGRDGRMDLQRNLRAMGLYEGKIDAAIGPLSEGAIDQFNTLFAEKIAQFETQRVNAVRDNALVRDNPQASNLFEQTYPLIERQGELSREELKTLQSNLHTLGLYQDTIDGRMSPNTRGAIGQFNTIMAGDITALQDTRLREARAQIDETLNCITELDALSPTQTATMKANLSRAGFEAGTGETQDKTFFQAVGAYAQQHNLEFYKAQLVAAAKDEQSIAEDTPTTPRDDVLRRQQQLTFAGIDPGPHDGIWKKGGYTNRAQEAFENIHTAEAVPLSGEKAIADLQRDLRVAGYYDGPIDGEISKGTRNAAHTFAQEHPHYFLENPDDGLTSRHAAAADHHATDISSENRFFLLPVQAENVRISSPHGMRMHPVLGYRRMHHGTDFAPKGANARLDGQSYPYTYGRGNLKVAAVEDLVVHDVSARQAGTIRFRIKGTTDEFIVYRHMESIDGDLQIGDEVPIGTTIGRVGTRGLSTAPHKHIEYWKDGKSQPFRFAYMEHGKPVIRNANEHDNSRVDYSKSDRAMEQLTGRQVGAVQDFRSAGQAGKSQPRAPEVYSPSEFFRFFPQEVHYSPTEDSTPGDLSPSTLQHARQETGNDKDGPGKTIA